MVYDGLKIVLKPDHKSKKVDFYFGLISEFDEKSVIRNVHFNALYLECSVDEDGFFSYDSHWSNIFCGVVCSDSSVFHFNEREKAYEMINSFLDDVKVRGMRKEEGAFYERELIVPDIKGKIEVLPLYCKSVYRTL